MPNRTVRSRSALARALVLLVAALAGAALTWRLRPTGWAATTPVDEIVSACAWLAWLLAGWLTLGVAVCAAGHLRGHRGPGRRVAVQCCVPRRLGRLVDAVVTAGLVGAVLGGAVVPATAAAAKASVAAASHRVATGDPLEWPGLAERSSAPHPHHQAPAQQRPRAPKVGLVSAAPRDAIDRDPAVTVRAGDSLWSIAAARLGPDATAAAIATQWPRWYAENRSVIGDDPTLILPGQQLRAPAEHGTDHSAHHRAGSSR
jgi:hypothetical protein